MLKQKQQKHKTYLDRITFDESMKKSFIAKYLGNIRFVILLLVAIIGIGIVSYLNLPRRLNPEVNIPIVTVVTLLPGASPSDVEQLLTVPLENKLRSLDSIDTIASTSRDSVSAITIQFTSNIDPEVAEEEAQKLVDDVSNLPEDAEDPQVQALDFEDEPVWTFAIRGRTADSASLMKFAESLKNDLDDNPKIDRVLLSGFEEQEIVIEFTPETLLSYGMNQMSLRNAVAGALASFPAGTVRTQSNVFSITVNPTVTSVSDLRDIFVNIEGQVLKLGDIATIYERPKPNQGASYYATPEIEASRVVTFSIYKTKSAQIKAAEESAQEIVRDSLTKNYGKFQLITITNYAEEVEKQFEDILHEFQATILLVFGTIFLFLGLRQAIISSFTVPLTFLATFFIMSQIGMSINFLSLFAFLLALGLLVDDTIVVISAMTTYFRTGKFTPYETGLMVWRDTIVPIWSTTITTIWSFVPLLLATGIIGEFIKPIPIVVSATMISSTAIAVLVTLPALIVILRPQIAKRVVILFRILGVLLLLGLVLFVSWGSPLLPLVLIVYIFFVLVYFVIRKNLFARIHTTSIEQSNRFHKTKEFLGKITDRGLINFEQFEKWYYRATMNLLKSKSARRKAIFAVILYSIIGFSLVPLGFVKNEFFPKSKAEIMYINLELPTGTKQEITKEESLKILDGVRHVDGIDSITLRLGSSFSSEGGSGSGENLANFTINMPPVDEQNPSSIDIAQTLRDTFEGYPKGKLSVIELSGGPPAGSDLQVKLSGDDLKVLGEVTDQVTDYLNQTSGVANVEKSVKQGTSTLVFHPNVASLSERGVDLSAIGFAIRTYTSGMALDSSRFGNTTGDEKDITLRLTNEDPTVEDLERLQVQTKIGGVPLTAFGTFVPETSLNVITREGGKRTISVSAGVLPGYSIPEKNNELQEFIQTIDLPEGYTWGTGGVNEENQKSVESIVQAMGLAALLILVTMVLQFGSFRQAIVVLLVIPLAVSSVFWAFALLGTPLSFPALIGVLSLFGIVVTNSMFIVDKINLNIREGMEFKEAIADAGASRLEPIILTKLCTVFGLLPITISDPLWRGLGGAIISGLLIASTIMLVFIPSVYYAWFKPSGVKE